MRSKQKGRLLAEILFAGQENDVKSLWLCGQCYWPVFRFPQTNDEMTLLIVQSITVINCTDVRKRKSASTEFNTSQSKCLSLELITKERTQQTHELDVIWLRYTLSMPV